MNGQKGFFFGRSTMQGHGASSPMVVIITRASNLSSQFEFDLNSMLTGCLRKYKLLFTQQKYGVTAIYA
jgi:hypothetical protein